MKISKKYLTTFTSLIIFVIVSFHIACTIDDYSYPYFHFFSPEISKSNLSVFYRNTDHHFYDYDSSRPIYDLMAVSANEWFEYFYKQIPIDDIKHLLFNSGQEELTNLLANIIDIRKNISVKSTELVNRLLFNCPDKKRLLSFFDYLIYAKKCEIYAAYEQKDTWIWRGNTSTKESSVKPNNPKDKNMLIKYVLNILKKQKNDFMACRFRFQIARLYFFAKEYYNCINFGKDAITKNVTRSINYRILGYIAGSYYKMKNYSYANYLYSRIFAEYPPMHKIAFNSFQPKEEEDWLKCFSYTKSKKKKTALWALMGIKNDPLRGMKEIYKIEPKSKYLDLLLTRAINIEEEKFLDVPCFYNEDSYDGSPELPHIYVKDFLSSAIDTNLVNFILKAAAERKTGKPYLWNLSAAYLLMAQGKYEDADLYFSKTRLLVKNDKDLTFHLNKLKFVSQIARVKTIDDAFESYIIKDFIRLKNQMNIRKTEYDSNYNAGAVISWTEETLAKKYVNQGNLIKAECLDPYNSFKFYSNPELKKQMLQFMRKERKTEFEKFILDSYRIKENDIYEFDAITLFNQGKVEEALNIFEKYPSADTTKLSSDPFSSRINDYYNKGASAYSHSKYTKHSFVKRVFKIIEQIKNKPSNLAELYFEVANAFYNTTYFGNSRIFYQCAIRRYSNCVDLGKGNKNKLNIPVMNCELAEYYYKKAFDASNNSEFKAKCLFMASKCEQNAFFVNMPQNYKGDFNAGKYFRQLKDDFQDTKYYKEIIKECGYFKTFTISAK